MTEQQDLIFIEAARSRLLSDLDGCVTISNAQTGNHRTFKVRTQAQDANFAPGKRIIALLTGPDNTSDYQPFGFVEDNRVRLWKSKQTDTFRKYADMLERPSAYESLGFITYQYEARCKRCGRLLTRPESITLGLGPECAVKVAA